MGRGEPRLRERLPDPSYCGLVYLVSTKSLWVFPVSGGQCSQDGLSHITAWRMGSKSPPSPQTAPNLPEGTWDHGGVQVALCPCFMGCVPAELVEVAHPGLSVHLSASLTAGNFPGLPCPNSRDERLPWWQHVHLCCAVRRKQMLTL